MKQKQETTKEQTGSGMESLKERFENANQAVTKTITVQYKSCCGCGCSYEDFEVTVPVDSKYNEGDIVTWDELEKLGAV